MIVKIGCEMEHGGERFVVVNINHEQTMDGKILLIRAFDPDMADKEQQKAMNVEQTQHQIVDMLKKMTGEGGPLGGIGFGLGG
jgi:hypothetical protein